MSETVGAVRLLSLGDAAWTVEFGDRIDPELFSRVRGFAAALEQARNDWRNGAVTETLLPGIVDVVPTFRSLTVFFDPRLCNGETLGKTLLRLVETAGAVPVAGRHWKIPVCFESEFAPDLDELAETKGLSRDEVIALMTETVFQVYMIGFMPGFPYMGGLPEILEIPRLPSPRKAVPARSLAIAGSMCAIYPWESPGGWRLLGRTPLPMFLATEAESPSLLASGDRVSWEAIDRVRFLEMEQEALVGRLDRSAFLLDEEE